MEIAGIRNLWDLIIAGGFAMWPLLVCSVLVWAVVFERARALWNLTGRCQETQDRLLPLVIKGQYDVVGDMCKGGKLPVELLAAFAVSKRGSSMLGEKIESKRKGIVQDFKRPLWILGTIGASAPFIGLFGTVVGIIRSFHSIAVTGQSGFTVVSAGISEALIATAAGIVVAVIAVVFYNYFNIRIGRVSLHLRTFAEELIEAIKEGRGKQDFSAETRT